MGRCTVAITGVLRQPVDFAELQNGPVASMIVESTYTYHDDEGIEHQVSTIVPCYTKGDLAIWVNNHLTPGKEVILIGTIKNHDDRLRIAIYRIVPTSSSWREGEAPPEEPDELPL